MCDLTVEFFLIAHILYKHVWKIRWKKWGRWHFWHALRSVWEAEIPDTCNRWSLLALEVYTKPMAALFSPNYMLYPRIVTFQPMSLARFKEKFFMHACLSLNVIVARDTLFWKWIMGPWTLSNANYLVLKYYYHLCAFVCVLLMKLQTWMKRSQKDGPPSS